MCVRKCLGDIDLGRDAPAAPAPKGKSQSYFSVSIERVNVSVREQVTDKVTQDLFQFFE